jgi:hypothetical protein
MSFNLVDALALLLGVFYGLRWASLGRARLSETGGEQSAARWRVQRAEARALTLMTSACFAKILLELGLRWLGPRLGIAPGAQSPMRLAIDLSWMVLMFLGLWMRASARRRRAELGMPP